MSGGEPSMYLLWKNVHSGLVRISLLLNQVLFFFCFYPELCEVLCSLVVSPFLCRKCVSGPLLQLTTFCTSAVASPLLVLCLMFSLIGPVCLFWFLVPLPEGTDPKRYC